MGLNDGHAQARMVQHMTKLISLHSLYTKNISSQFRRNLMKQNRYMLENVHFRSVQPNCPAHFFPFCPKTTQRDFFLKNRFLPLFTPYCPLTSCKKSEKTNDSIFFKVQKTSFLTQFGPILGPFGPKRVQGIFFSKKGLRHFLTSMVP